MDEEQKRPVLSLKSRTRTGEVVRHRKTVIQVATPSPWKVLRQPRAERAAREAARVAEKARITRELNIYLTLLPLPEATAILKPWWPGLFDGSSPRQLACGIREKLLAEVDSRGIPLSHKKLLRALKAIAHSEGYLAATKTGAPRYAPEGTVAGSVTAREASFAVARLAKLQRQNDRKAALRAALEKV